MVRSLASMATSVPVPMAMPRSASGERRRVVHAVADHGHDPALGAQPAISAALSSGRTSAITRWMPTSAATALGRASRCRR
jgi:hypothetical protein